MKKVLALLLAVMMVAALSVTAFADDAGFEEIPIWEDEEVAFLNVSAVYFQPVPMAPDQEDIEGFDLHLECDVSAMENDLGYELGSWVPYMTIDFEVVTFQPVFVCKLIRQPIHRINHFFDRVAQIRVVFDVIEHHSLQHFIDAKDGFVALVDLLDFRADEGKIFRLLVSVGIEMRNESANHIVSPCARNA